MTTTTRRYPAGRLSDAIKQGPRASECVVCGETFAIIPRHPMVENDSYCQPCLAIVFERIREQGWPWQGPLGSVDRAEGV